MTYDQALNRAQAIDAMPDHMAKLYVERWNRLEDDLKAMPFKEFNTIYDRAKEGCTMADFMLVCMCEG